MHASFQNFRLIKLSFRLNSPVLKFDDQAAHQKRLRLKGFNLDLDRI